MNTEQWETELIRRLRDGRAEEVKAYGNLKSYCGVTWQEVTENPYRVILPEDIKS